jgi:hypothetical protein
MRAYSPFFQTLYDETAPVGSLGRGTHYSVLRATVFHDALAEPLKEARFLDFAVVWDEDHDERVLLPIERLYRSGDLSSFIIYGERKGTLFCCAAPRLNGVHLPAAEGAVALACRDVGGDQWSGHISFSERGGGGIINDDERSVGLYLDTIKMLWRLGLKEIEPKKPQGALKYA